MNTNNKGILKRFLENHLSGTVYLASWLKSQGISSDLQQRYVRNEWLERIGSGAFKRPGDKISWQHGLNALQTQKKLAVHAGALTALALQGYAHYARSNEEKVFLFSRKMNLAAWFREYDWGETICHKQTSQLPAELGLKDYQQGELIIKISSPERALLECLYLAPETVDLVECYQILEGLTTLRPKLLQKLLPECSVKIKRLFFFMAEKVGHRWAERLNIDQYDLGKGSRAITKGGVYVPRYQLTLPEELVNL